MVINKGLGHADGLGPATVGGKEPIKHRGGKKRQKRNQVEFLFESLKKIEKKKK